MKRIENQIDAAILMIAIALPFLMDIERGWKQGLVFLAFWLIYEIYKAALNQANK